VQTKDRKYQRKEEIRLEVNGDLWHRVSNLKHSAANDNHYVVKIDDEGTAVIIFGDGKHGARLPTGKNNIKVTFSPNKSFSGVRLQQGRVQLDDDWNESDEVPGGFFGIYRGIVSENIDPESLMRLRVQVPAVLGTQEIWALPCITPGTSVIPPIGQGVWVMFENGDPARPVWMGTWSC